MSPRRPVPDDRLCERESTIVGETLCYGTGRGKEKLYNKCFEVQGVKVKVSEKGRGGERRLHEEGKGRGERDVRRKMKRKREGEHV